MKQKPTNNTEQNALDSTAHGNKFSIREAVFLFHICALASIPIAYLYENGEKAEDTTQPAETIDDNAQQKKKSELSSAFTGTAYVIDFLENTPVPETLNRNAPKIPSPRP